MEDEAEVVIIGGGVQGLATAYNLAKKGLTDVVVAEKSYIGSGGSGRNAGGIRAQYNTAESIILARESRRIAEEISEELGFNIMFRQGGYLYLAYDEKAFQHLRENVKLQNSLGVDTKILYADEMKELVPALRVDNVIGGCFNNKDGVARHDAVVWGYARQAARLGVKIYPFTEVLDLRVSDGRIRSVVTDKGEIETKTVVNAAAIHSRNIALKAGVKLPLFAGRRDIWVTESLKPFLDPMVINTKTSAYYNQTDRGEVVASFHHLEKEDDDLSTRSSAGFLRVIAKDMLGLFPDLASARVLRQWAGTYDITPDESPILGPIDGVKGFIQTCGWSGTGFKMCFIVGKLLAELIVDGKTSLPIDSLNLRRFKQGRLLRESLGGYEPGRVVAAG